MTYSKTISHAKSNHEECAIVDCALNTIAKQYSSCSCEGTEKIMVHVNLNLMCTYIQMKASKRSSLTHMYQGTQ